MSKPVRLSLSEYVRRRNGVPLGHRDSLRNMLSRSFGAPSFDRFWLFWNPIWGYYLGRWVLRPANRFLPAAAAVWLTFVVSGALHDLACSLLERQPIILFTTWFAVIGFVVVLSPKLGWKISRPNFVTRILVNASWLVGCYFVAQLIRPDGL